MKKEKPMRMLTAREQHILYSFHCCVKRIEKLRELHAPSVIMANALKVALKRTRQIARLGIGHLYGQYEARFEEYRINTDRETDKKFDCLHHAEYVSKLTHEQVQDAKNICPYGGYYGSEHKCQNCLNFQALTEQDRERLEWH
jgi:hypothetical protein